MATRPVTVRVDEDVYARAKIYIDREGATFRSAVAAMLSDIAETGEVPGTGGRDADGADGRGRRIMREYRRAIAAMPALSPEQVPGDGDVRRMTRNRDDL